jgi:hypothetical protein
MTFVSSRLRIKRRIRFYVVGGLGNQLFIYFAAIHYASSFDRRLEISLIFKATHHSSWDITSFRLPEEFIAGNPTLFWKFLWRIRDSMQLRIPLSQNLLPHVQVLKDGEVPRNSDTNPLRIRGNFTTIKFAKEAIETSDFKLILKAPSKWYLEMEARAELHKPISIHIRRTDNLFSKNSDGVLREEFFNDALMLVEQKIGIREVWIFTDNPAEVRQWQMFAKREVKVVLPPNGEKNDPAEHMKLMTLASANIIGNSSFAIFGALFNHSGEIVVCPNEPLRNGRIGWKELYCENWVRIEPKWED